MNTEPGKHIVFGAFRLDQDQGQLWRDEQVVALQPKPLAVLQYLAQRPGQVVSSKELLKTVWAGVYVTKAVVKECLRAIRGALGEDVTAPQYIETVGREGYRFIGQAGSRQSSVVRTLNEPLALNSRYPPWSVVTRNSHDYTNCSTKLWTENASSCL